MKGFSSRFHLALGLSSLVASVLLLALYFGLVPDRDGAVRAGRQALAEAVAIASTAVMDEQEDSKLRNLLGFIAVLAIATASASACRPARTAPSRSGTRPKYNASNNTLATSELRPRAR